MTKYIFSKIHNLTTNRGWRVSAGAALALALGACAPHGMPAAMLDTAPRPTVVVDSSRGWPAALLDTAAEADVAALESPRGWPAALLDAKLPANVAAAGPRRSMPAALLDAPPTNTAPRVVNASQVAEPAQGTR